MSEPASIPTDASTEPMSKVFVGNLAFRTTDQDLQTLFKECGEIKAGVIITRGRRSLGYGFIEFVKPEDAAESVNVMNKKEFLGRPLKVELAKDPSERPDRMERTDNDDGETDEPQQPRQKRGRRNGKDAAAPVQTPVAPAQPAGPPGSDAAPGPKKNRRRRGPKNAGDAPPTEQSVVHTPAAPTDSDEKGPAQKRRAPRKNKKKAVDGAPENNAPTEPAAPAQPRAKRTPPANLVKKEKVNSKTTLFVANLPFSVDDDALKAIFEGFNVKSAHVVRTYNNRSRGYGFVEFETEEDQLKALETKNGFAVAGVVGETGVVGEPRPISISISSSNVSTPEEAAQTPQ